MRNRILMAALVAFTGQALAGGVFFSEYIEGSSNNKALEIFNNTGGQVDLADVVINRYNNGGTSPSGSFGYSGILADGDVYVIANSSADPAILGVSNTTDGSTYYNGDDALELVYQGTTVDMIGIIGEDPGSNWPVGTGATSEHTLVRKLAVCVGTTDWTVGASQWDVYPQNTFDYLGSHTVDCAANQSPIVESVTVVPAAPVLPGELLTFTVTTDDNDGVVTGVDLSYGTDPMNLTTSIALDGDGFSWTNLAPVVAPGLCEILYYEVVATDDDAATGAAIGSVEVECPAVALTIYEIQGQAASSPYEGSVVETSGVVTALAYNGFYLQDGFGAWNGIWVYAGSGNTGAIATGDLVVVSDVDVVEYNGLTELELGGGSFSIVSSGNALPAPVLLSTGAVNDEQYEGVLVRVENAFASATTGYGEYPLDDGSGITKVDDQINTTDGVIEEGECYDVTGPLNYSFGEYKIAASGPYSPWPCGVVEADELVHSFELGQAYPNPFNPTTSINFSMDVTAEASLSVFNLLGQEVAVLAQGVMEAGQHQVTFDASALTSGMYLYRLESEGRNLTGRMLLLK